MRVICTTHVERMLISIRYHKGMYGTKNWLRGYKTFLCSAQLSLKLIVLITIKMPTVVGILTFMSMIIATSERLKAIRVLFSSIFDFMSIGNFMLSWVEHEKRFITSGPGHVRQTDCVIKVFDDQVLCRLTILTDGRYLVWIWRAFAEI